MPRSSRRPPWSIARGTAAILSGTAGELGLNYWTLRDWVEAARAAAPPVTPRTAAELEAEVRWLRGALARVTERREILEKSLGILSTP